VAGVAYGRGGIAEMPMTMEPVAVILALLIATVVFAFRYPT
jgi:hypothetical protein